MKGDFSRDTFRPDKHYSAVLKQMGRVDVDADSNEQQAINEYRAETEALDTIGGCGAPKYNAGFGITTDGKTFFIGKGRYYADGVLCENDADKLTFETQPDLPGATIADILEDLKKAGALAGLVYLDVWKRHITALDDPLLRERALGGADTATRVQTVWQVKVLPVAAGNSDRLDALRKRQKDLQAQQRDLDNTTAALQDQMTQAVVKLGQLPATSPQRAKLQLIVAKLTASFNEAKKASDGGQAELVKVDAEIAAVERDTTPTCGASLKEWDGLPRLSTGTLNARAQAETGQSDPCLPPPYTGYTRLENQLYRVEVHEPGQLGTATFKWSRDNGSVVASIEKITGATLVVHDLGRDDLLGFKAGDWVEITDDTHELNGLPGQLAQINPPNAATREITLVNATPIAVDPAVHPKLRRWDQVNVQAAPADLHGVKTSNAWLPLEDGVEVQFSAGDYRSGDYWLIPARTATGDVEWPPYAVPNINPIAQLARGIEHHYCRLALIQVNDGQLGVLEDCRSIFCPLTEVNCGATTAIHVAATNWENDDFMAFTEQSGLQLRITLDAAPDPASVNDGSMTVTVDMPFREGTQVTPGMFQRLVLDGASSIDEAKPRVIVWTWAPKSPNNRELNALLAAMQAPEPAPPKRRGRARANRPLAVAVARRQQFPLIRVTLKGSFVWRIADEDVLYLDGEAFGVAGLRSDKKTSRTALTFPTGAGAKASDFESWFYVGAREPSTLGIGLAVNLKSPRSSKGEMPTALSIAIERNKLSDVLPSGYQVDGSVAFDPAKAREIVIKHQVQFLFFWVPASLEKLGGRIAEMYRNINLAMEFIVVPDDEIDRRLKAAAAAGNPPDVVLATEAIAQTLNAVVPDLFDGSVIRL